MALMACGAGEARGQGTAVLSGGADAAAQPAPAQGTQEVTIELEQFGYGDCVRECDWAGVSLVFSDPLADKPRNVEVRLAIRDDDGDTQYRARRMALSMGARVRAWLYLRIPKQTTATSVFTVSIHEVNDTPGGAGTVGRQLAFTRVTPRRVIGPNNDDGFRNMIGVIGRRTLGLEQYELRAPDGSVLPTANEPSVVIGGLGQDGSRQLPDQWEGLAPYEVIVWTEGGPESLEDPRPQALREWVNRGGHLVVVLPAVGSTWFNASSPLKDLMPLVKVNRVEDQSLEAFRGLLCGGGAVTGVLPGKTVVQSFEPLPDATVSEATEVISGAQGCVVSRRLVGTGMVTVVGLDIGAGTLANGLLRADQFWHRLLGKRFDIPTREQASKIPSGGIQPGSAYADAYVGVEIAKQRAAGVGVLLGLVVFAAYWITAGPGGFGLLKSRGMVRHAWVGFAGATAVFTAISWAGATALRPRQVEAQHLTYLTHVYGQPVQGARMWASVLLPSYGDREITVGRADEDTAWRQALTIWSEPIGSERPKAFPDARAYSVDVRRLHTAKVPARATIKQVQADWLGGPRWGMPAPVSADRAPALVRRESTLGVTGELTHGLPGVLRDVTLVLVTGQKNAPRDSGSSGSRGGGAMVSVAYAWGLFGSEGWAPGTVLPLSSLDFSADPRFEKHAETLAPMSELFGLVNAQPGSLDPKDARRFHELASWFGVLPQPDWQEAGRVTGSRRAVLRRLSASCQDLSKWFTQPCLIVVGHLTPGPSPVPLLVDGEECPSTGRTVVRWVYPLSSYPARFAEGVRAGVP